MNFIVGFEKTAISGSDIWKGVKTMAGHAKDIGGGALQGLKASGDVALKKHLNPMNAVNTIRDAAKSGGGFSNAFKSQQGRAAMGKALGAAVPGVAAAGAYAAGSKKVYDKTIGNNGSNEQYDGYPGFR